LGKEYRSFSSSLEVSSLLNSLLLSMNVISKYIEYS
jgi:hypothetical protein